MPQGVGLCWGGRAHPGPADIIQKFSDLWSESLPLNCCVLLPAPFTLFLQDRHRTPIPLESLLLAELLTLPWTASHLFATHWQLLHPQTMLNLAEVVEPSINALPPLPHQFF